MNKNDIFAKKFPDQRHLPGTDLQKAQRVMLRMLKIVDYICRENNISYWLEAGTLLGAVRHQNFIPWDDDLDISMLREDFNKFIDIASSALPDDIFLQTAATEKCYFNPAAPYKLRDNNSKLVELDEREDSNFNQGIFIDIFPYDNVPDNMLEYKKHKNKIRKLLKIKRDKIMEYRTGKLNLKYLFLSKFYQIANIDQYVTALINKMNSETTNQISYGYDFVAPIIAFPRDCIFPLRMATFADAEFPVPGDYQRFLSIKYGDYLTLPPENERVPRHLQQLIVAKDIINDE